MRDQGEDLPNEAGGCKEGLDFTHEEWMDEVYRILSTPPEQMRPPGTGWFTFLELREKFSQEGEPFIESRMRDRIQRLVRDGIMEKSGVSKAVFYRLKPKAPEDAGA